MNHEKRWSGLPGADLIEQGLADLCRERVTEHALLVLIAKTRLQHLDIKFPNFRPSLNGSVEHALYDLLVQKYDNDAHSRYNSLLRRMNSFAHSLEREYSRSGGVTHQT